MKTPEENLVSSVLREYGDATRSVLFQYLPTAEPRRYLYDLVADYPRRGGRSFRPSLCIATARAFGAAPSETRRVTLRPAFGTTVFIAPIATSTPSP